MSRLKRWFFAGLAVSFPLVATVLIVRWVISVSDKFIAAIPPAYHPDVLFGVHIPGIGVLMAILTVIGIGVLATNIVGRSLVQMLEGLLNRVPVVRSIYGAIKQLTDALFGGSKQSFSRVVLVSFPQPGQWTLGFVTGEKNVPSDRLNSEDMVSVFVPTTPNPTSGWLLFVSSHDIEDLPVTVEEGLKMVVSGGIVVPAMKAKEQLS